MDVQAIKRRVREQFAGAGDAYVLSETHRFGKDLQRLLEVAQPRPDMDALDIATDGGHTALALAPYVRQVVLLDLTPEMLGHARDFVDASGAEPLGYVAAAAEELPFRSETFDLVTCRIAPHHFADVPRSVHEVSRVLRPGGSYVMIDSLAPEESDLDAFINTLEWRRDNSHVRSYRLSEWTTFFEQAGMSIEHSEPIVKRHDYASWTARSRMTEQERDDLADWVLNSSPACLSHFDVETDGGGRLISFADLKLLVRARKRA